MSLESAAMMMKSVDTRKSYKTQWLAAFAVSIGPLAGGLGKGYSSPAIASLQANSTSEDSSVIVEGQPFSVSNQEASWVASLSLLGALFGAILGGVAMRMGRQRVLLFISIPFGMSWLFTAFANSVLMLYATSLSAGFFTAIATMVTQVYISEATLPEVRGRLSSLSKIFSQLGILISFLIGSAVNWKVHAGFIAIMPMILCLSVIKIPETPSYLILRGKEDEAAKSLQWLRGPDADVRKELATIRTNILHMSDVRKQPYGDLFSPRLIVPISITCGVMFFQRFTGAHAFNFYAVSVFKKTFGELNPHMGAIVMSIVQTFASCLSGCLIDKIGRLPLLISSGVLMSLALAGFGSYIYYDEFYKSAMVLSSTHPSYDWVPLLCVLVFSLAFSLGISPISWLLIGELFPLEYRNVGSALASTFSYLCAFVSVKTFVDFQENLGLSKTFWVYSFISICGLIFVVFFVPETRGREMDEMDPKYIESVCIKR